MKNIFILLLLATFAQAQSTSISFVLSSDNVNYLQVTRVTAEDGLSYSETAALVGPASALAADQADKIEQGMSALAAQAYVVSYTNKRIKELNTTDSTITAITALSPLAVIQARYLTKLTTAGWTIKNGAEVPLAFTQNAQGVLRYSINGAATKQARMLGPIIRLFNYPSNGVDTDFFLDESGKKYFSLPDRNVIIKKPSQ